MLSNVNQRVNNKKWRIKLAQKSGWEWRFQNSEPMTVEEIKRPSKATKRYKSKRTHHSLPSVSHFYRYFEKKKRKENDQKRIFPQRVEYGRNSKYQTQKNEDVRRNGWLAICDIKNCHNKNGAVIKINYFIFCKVCEGRKLTQTAREMRKHSSHAVFRTLFPNLSLPRMPFFCHVPALCSSAVLFPSSSIKLSHVFLWSAVHSLSHHSTISLPTSCWNITLREPLFLSLAAPQCPGSRAGGGCVL